MSQNQATKPHNDAAEKKVLGACIRDKDALAIARDMFGNDKVFYESKHQIIFDAIVKVTDAGTSLCLESLGDKLDSQGELEKIGGAFILAELAKSVTTSANIETHSEIVKKESDRRKLIRFATELQLDAQAGQKKTDELIAEYASKLPSLFVIKQATPSISIPQIDESAFHGLAGEIVWLIAPHTEADPVALLTQFLALFGNIIGRSAYWRVGATNHYLNLFIVLIGQSSRGRKGSSFDCVFERFKAIDELWSTERKVSGLSSGEGLMNVIRDAKADEDQQHNDFPEDKRLLVYEPEFASVLKVCKREGNTLSANIRQAWDSGNLRTLTKNDPIKVTNGHISIISHITQEELKRDLTQTESANGFANRFLFFWVTRSKMLPHGGELDSVDFTDFDKSLDTAIRFAKEEHPPITMTHEAKKIWESIYPHLTRDVHGLVGALTSRGEAQVKRIACIYALLDLSSVIKPEHLQAALALWEYSFDSCVYIFGQSHGDHITDKIIKALTDKYPEAMTKTEITRLFNNNAKAAQIDQALESLLQGLCITKEDQTNERGNKPTTLYRLTNLRN